MTNTLYVSNLAFEANEQDIKNHFSTIGEVTKIQIILDRETRRPRGFCFVSYSTSDLAAEALKTLNGSMLLGRPLRISEARTREQNSQQRQHNLKLKNPAQTPHHLPAQQHGYEHNNRGDAPQKDTSQPPHIPHRNNRPRKKYSKEKPHKNRNYYDDDFDRPRGRRPRIQDFDEEDY